MSSVVTTLKSARTSWCACFPPDTRGSMPARRTSRMTASTSSWGSSDDDAQEGLPGLWTYRSSLRERMPVRPVPGLGRSAVGQACEDHGGEGVTRKKIGDVMGPGYVDEVGGGRESGGGVAPRSTPLPSKDAAANPPSRMRWDLYKPEAERHERIRA